MQAIILGEIMDATNMSFEKNSWPVVIDKGTFDALMCGDQTLARNLIFEMGKVAQEVVIIISHGQPEQRNPFFIDNMTTETYTFESRPIKCELSTFSQLINILRNKCKDKPLNHAMKDKKILIEAMLELKEHIESKDRKTILIKHPSKSKKPEQQAQQQEQQEQQEQQQTQTKEEQKQIIEEVINQTSQQEENKIESEQAPENPPPQSNEQQQQGEASNTSEEANMNEFSKRQTHCFVYFLKKLYKIGK